MSQPPPDEAALVMALYAAPLSDFVAARKDAAAAMRATGDRGAAARIKRLPKPTAAAWAANALHRACPEGWAAMTEAAAALRDAQASGGQTAQDMQTRVEAQRTTLAALLREAPGLCEAVGQKLNRDHETKLRATLQALCAGTAATAGQLSTELSPPSFGAFDVGGFAPQAPAVEPSGGPIASAADQAGIDTQRRRPTGPAGVAARKATPAARQATPTVTPRDRERAHTLQRLRELESIRDARSAQRDKVLAHVHATTEELQRARAEVAVTRRRLQRAEEEAAKVERRLHAAEAELARLADALRQARQAVAEANAALTRD